MERDRQLRVSLNRLSEQELQRFQSTGKCLVMYFLFFVFFRFLYPMNMTYCLDAAPLSNAPSEQEARREHMARTAESRRLAQNGSERRVNTRLLGRFALRIMK